MRIVEVHADSGHLDTLHSLAEKHEVIDVWCGPVNEDGRLVVRMLVRPEQRQALIDSLQSLLSGSEGARILILPVEAVLPRPPEEEPAEGAKSKAATTTREELYNNIAKGARLDSNFLWLVVLSTVVASIGLIEDNVAVVVGAMVIAPLLGPNLALALATALGDTQLSGDALKTNVVGLGLALVLSFAIGTIWDLNYESSELMSRTVVGMDSIALALASGAAAVLSLTTGLPTALVGVMVAVALLPPGAVLGMMLGAGRIDYALGAALLLAVNVVCVNLSAKLVFLVRGVKPRTWLEKRKARQSMVLYIALWIVSLLFLIAVIYWMGPRLFRV